MRRVAAAALVGCLVAIVAAIPPAPAHPWQEHYVVKNTSGNSYTFRWPKTDVAWSWEKSYYNSGTDWWLRANDAAASWNNNGTRVAFRTTYALLEDGTLDTYCSNPDSTVNGIRKAWAWSSVNEKWVSAMAQVCGVRQPNGGEWPIRSFAITVSPKAIDNEGNQYPWYTGTGQPPYGQRDLWGVLAHEFGHATGFREHPVDPCGQDDDARATMCAQGSWSTRERSLSDHDRHTHSDAYLGWPPPPPPPATTTTTAPPGGSMPVGAGGPGCDSTSGGLYLVMPC